ncbi:MAG: hypothetical protein WCX22_04255 [Methanoregula sp.]
MATATYTIKQFGIVSVGKFFALFGLVWGFLMGFVVAVGVSSMGSVMGTHALGFAGGLVALCIMTIIGGVIGFIGGAVVAIIYNLVVEATGGVELDLEVKGQV